MTHYEEFGLAANATPDEIRHAHRNLARLLHPDHIQDDVLRALAECQMKRLNAIYAVLIDPSRRRMYDLQAQPPGLEVAVVAGVEGIPPPEAVHGIGWRQRFREWAMWPGAPWLVGLALLLVVLASLWEPHERIVYVQRPAAMAAQPAPTHARELPSRNASAEPRQAGEDTRELRRLLSQAISERDQAVGRLSVPPAAMAAAAAAPSERDSAPPHAGKPDSPADPQTGVESAARPRLGGTWIYAAGAHARPASDEQYPADYIELVLDEQEGHLRGRYRARYRIPDRALSPDVEFFFEGEAAAAAKYPWRGNGGSRGELQLRLTSENTLSVGWFTSQLGRVPSLGSGSAVLIRRQESQP